MPFTFYNEFYGTYIGTKIRGAIGKRYVYQVVGNVQKKYPYFVPTDPKSSAQLRQRDLLRKAVQSWHTLTNQQQQYYRNLEPFTPIMSGFNYYVRIYIKSYLP